MTNKEIKILYNNIVRNIIKYNPNLSNKKLILKFVKDLLFKITLYYFIKDRKIIKEHFSDIFERFKVNKNNGNYFDLFLRRFLDNFSEEWSNIKFFNQIDLRFDDFTPEEWKIINNIFIPNEIFDPNKKNSVLNFFSRNKISTEFFIFEEYKIGTDIFSYIYELYKGSEKKRFGIYYTNKFIANFLTKKVLIRYIEEKLGIEKEDIKILFSKDINVNVSTINKENALKIIKIFDNFKVLDPAMGTGTFLISILEDITLILLNCKKIIMNSNNIDKNELLRIKFKIINESLYGIDIEKEAMDIAALMILLPFFISSRNLKFRNLKFNFLRSDFLKINNSNISFKFDIIIGNPPYAARGRGISKETAKKLGLMSMDLYGAFIVKSLEFLKVNGYLSFLTSDTWRTIESHLPLRRRVLNSCGLIFIVSLPIWLFEATVNTSIFILKSLPGDKNRFLRLNSDVQAIDLTGIPVKNKNILIDILGKLIFDRLDGNFLKTNVGFYKYQQKILLKYSKIPIIIASPKIFSLMNDQECDKHSFPSKNKSLLIYKIIFNGNRLNLLKFGDISIIKQGLGTGDNKYYIRKSNEKVYGNYKVVDKKLILNGEQLIEFSKKYRRYYEKTGDILGIDDNDYGGKKYIPYDKGAESNIKEGWLPNYWVPTNYYINWSKEAINRLKNLTIIDRERYYGKKDKIELFSSNKIASRLQNFKYYFKKGITYSDTGFYAPTFRLNHSSVFDVMGMTIFTEFYSLEFCLGILCSKLVKYLLKNYINSTVHTQVGGIKQIPIPLIDKDNKSIMYQIEDLVNKIIQKQHDDQKYPYFIYEQTKIDYLVYKLYQLSNEDINEIENWYKRRYHTFYNHLRTKKIKGKNHFKKFENDNL
ncbi:MAG: Eco57I restriction-modification methylase domain-containing protein [Candidatus Helarchaeota archaeon]